jgi:hypothetical protein
VGTSWGQSETGTTPSRPQRQKKKSIRWLIGRSTRRRKGRMSGREDMAEGGPSEKYYVLRLSFSLSLHFLRLLR